MLAVPVLPLELRLDGQGFARHGDGVGRAAHQDLQVRRRERLGEIIPRAGAQRFEARIDARVAGDHEDDGVRVRLQAGAQQAQAGDLGHIEVEEHDVEPVALQRLARLVATATQADLIPLVLQDAGAALSQRAVVVHDQHADGGLQLGRELAQPQRRPDTTGTAVRGSRGGGIGWGRTHRVCYLRH